MTSHPTARTPLRNLLLLALALVLFAQAALAAPPPRRGTSAPEARKPTTQNDAKRVCIDLGIGKPIVRTIPYQRWPRGVVPNGKIVWMSLSTVVRNHSTTDHEGPFSVSIVARYQNGQTKPLWVEKVTRGLDAGKAQRLDFGFYYDFSNLPAQFALRAEFLGTRSERNDCKEQNDASQYVGVDAQRLADAAIGR